MKSTQISASSIKSLKTKHLNSGVIVKLQHKMNSKTLLFVIASVLTAFLVLSSASAFTLSDIDQLSMSKKNATLTVTPVVGEIGQTFKFNIPAVSGITFASIADKIISTADPFNVEIKATTPSSLNFGKYTATINVSSYYTNSSLAQSSTKDFSFVKGFCSNGPKNTSLKIDSVKIENTGTKRTTWELLDTITVTVKVKNPSNEDVDDVFVELGLLDSNGENRISDVDFISKDDEQADIGSIGDDSREEVAFEFKVPADMPTASYKLVVKAYSDNENTQCIDTSDDLETDDLYIPIKIDSKDDEGEFIAFDEIKLSSAQATCGDVVTLSTIVSNVGEDDEDRIRINLVNKELGVDLTQELKSGLEQGDTKLVSFDFTLPDGLAEKTYNLMLDAEYDYRNSGYGASLDEQVPVSLKVFGCEEAVTPTTRIASVSASPEGTVTAGEKVNVKATITNLGKSAVTFVFNARGYDSYAALDSISQRTALLAAGESKEITITLLANKDVIGSKTLSVEAIAGDNTITEDVRLSFPEKAQSSLSLSLGSNWLIWVIGAVNIILIVVIILVAIRVSRR